MTTPMQIAVSDALEGLKFEKQPYDGEPGSPNEFTITEETVKYVQSLEGKTISVSADGKVSE